MANPNKIALIRTGRYEEGIAGDAITPGMLVKRATGRTVLPHAGGIINEKSFAVEDSLQGKTINDDYSMGDVVRYEFFLPGDVVYGLVAVGANVADGEILVSNGDGTLVDSSSLADLLYATDDSSQTVTDTTDETEFDNSYTIPAGTLNAGDVIRVQVTGYTPSTNSTDTLTVKLKIGSTVLVATAATDVANNDAFVLEATLVFRAVGASGSFTSTGKSTIGAEGTATVRPDILIPTAVNTTVGLKLAATAQWSAASADNQAIMTQMTVTKMTSNMAGGIQPIGIAMEAVNNAAGTAPAHCRIRVL